MKRPGWPDPIEGTFGLLYGTALLLLAAMLEPALPATFPRWTYTVPAVVLLAGGLATLPRDGLAAQARTAALARAPDWRAITRRLPWLALAIVMLLPRLFLGAYGIPHLNPLVGLVPQQWVVRVATAFLFVVMLAPTLYLRAGLRGPEQQLADDDPRTGRRDALFVGALLLLVAWGLLLRPFWAPFSLLQWPPEAWSLAAGARGVAALAFAVVPPVVLFMALAANVSLARNLSQQARTPARDQALAATALQVLLVLIAAFLHGYDLLWIARYESLAQF